MRVITVSINMQKFTRSQWRRKEGVKWGHTPQGAGLRGASTYFL